jgi:hypothetical protein
MRITIPGRSHNYMPTQSIAVLFSLPQPPHVKVALIEAQRMVDGGEAAP